MVTLYRMAGSDQTPVRSCRAPDSTSPGRPVAAAGAPGPEDMTADIADGVIQPLQRLLDPLPGQLGGLARGRVQAGTDVEQAADDPVQQVLSMLRLFREHGADQAGEVVLSLLACGVPDHRQDEMAAGGRDRPQ